MDLARREKVPPYVICSNATLSAMAALAPRSIEQFMDIPGIGEKKAARYGKAFIMAIAEYERSGE